MAELVCLQKPPKQVEFLFCSNKISRCKSLLFSLFFSMLAKTSPTPFWKTSRSARNLRIREDTAKYLLNLDVNSAYYDPKSRLAVVGDLTAKLVLGLPIFFVKKSQLFGDGTKNPWEICVIWFGIYG